jgi:hypothetical protein
VKYNHKHIPIGFQNHVQLLSADVLSPHDLNQVVSAAEIRAQAPEEFVCGAAVIHGLEICDFVGFQPGGRGGIGDRLLKQFNKKKKKISDNCGRENKKKKSGKFCEGKKKKKKKKQTE